jgi:hypothetical protein
MTDHLSNRRLLLGFPTMVTAEEMLEAESYQPPAKRMKNEITQACQERGLDPNLEHGWAASHQPKTDDYHECLATQRAD